MYVILWEFLVRPEKIGAFVTAYKSDGAWAKLFAHSEGYVGTELLAAMDKDQGATFVTIDRWKTREDFASFQENFGSEYRQLDTQLEGLTAKERKLGTFFSD